jgi:serine/threonine protein kinase
MEVLTGSPLDDFIKDHPKGLPQERVAPIVRGMCLGLAYAHNKGIVHSDFKPGNVFLGAKDNPKILDFGIARAAPVNETQTREASEQTQFDAGELGALTPSYAAKEMFFGGDPHPSDDIYALAITVYQLLTGRHPFDNKPAPQAEAEGLKPAPIPGIKRREWNAIRHGLAFNRDNRQQHAADFLREFEGQSKLRLVASAAVVLALAFAGYFGFVQVQEQARIAPDIAFEDLNGEVQSQVTAYLNDGKGLELFQDYAGALAQYRNAYELHPRNPDAVESIISLMEKLRDIAVAANSSDTAFNLLQNLNDLMETDGFLSSHDGLKEVRSELEQLL